MLVLVIKMKINMFDISKNCSSIINYLNIIFYIIFIKPWYFVNCYTRWKNSVEFDEMFRVIVA